MKNFTVFLILSLLAIFSFLPGQYGDLDEKGDYYIVNFGGYDQGGKIPDLDYYDYFGWVNLDGDSLFYRGMFESEGDSGKRQYSIDDSNYINLLEGGKVTYQGLMSQDGFFTHFANPDSDLYDLGMFSLIPVSSGMTNSDMAGEYIGAMLEMTGVEPNKLFYWHYATGISEMEMASDGTGFIYLGPEDTLAIMYEIQDDGHFIISEEQEIEGKAEMDTVDIFAGILSPDGEMFTMSWILDDFPYEKEVRIVVAAKKSSQGKNSVLQGNYRYYQYLLDNESLMPSMQIHDMTFDGDGNGTYYMKQSSDGGDLISGTFTYSVKGDGRLSLTGSNEYGDFELDGFIDPKSRITVMTWSDTDSSSDLGFGIGVAKPVPPVSVHSDGFSPNEFRLEQNYPNPFNPSTIINYYLPTSSEISINIYNSLGQKIRALYSGRQLMGPHQTSWDGKNNLGNNVSSGVYFYQFKTAGKTISKKMTLLR